MSAKTMNGIDISSWQNGIDLAKVKCDFVICKATEGRTEVDECCDKFMTTAEKLGKCLGFYHFARPENNEAKTEAKVFYENTKGYYGKAIPILDWESSDKWNVSWALTWLDEVYRLSKVKPMIYMSESTIHAYDWSKVAKAGYKLWVAKYRDYETDKNYDMSKAGEKPQIKYWTTFTMWQWTSSGRITGYNGDLDCDIFYGDKTAWNALVQATKATTTTKKKYSGTFPKLPSKGYLEEGDTGTQVKYLQKFLNWYGNYKLTIDGIFGPKTDAALRKFQKAEKLAVDGMYGKKSSAKAQAIKK